MAAESVGQIGLDLVVNKNGFNKQMQGITGLAKKAGAALAAAFAVKKIIDFGSACIELGSDLTEVQNVVDVTFGSMSTKVDEFAKSAAASFGLSETMAKKFTGTFGSMAKAFGLSDDAAYDMSTSLTGLSGDLASFYNISQDEAYTKLKSVFTGETESLKDLGVVMTQSALDSYALANGFGKTTSAMSEAEKVMLRYSFVTDKLSLAQGDFSRTSDSWANQVRILGLQFDSLKATLGQGFINLFTPIIKSVNTLISKLQIAANAFKSFTEAVSGKASSGTATSSIASDAETATSSLNGVTDAATEAAKAAGSIGIDEINVLNDTSTDTSSDSTDESSTVADTTSEAVEEVNKLAEKFTEIKQLCVDIGDKFTTGFLNPIKTVDFSNLKTNLDGIKDNLSGIFTNSDLAGSASAFIDSYISAIGAYIGKFVTVGTNIALNLIGGFNQFLDENSESITSKLTGIFDAGTKLAETSEKFSNFIGEISGILTSDSAVGISANIMGIFSEGFLGSAELIANFGADFYDMVVTPITENSEGIKTAIEGTLEPIETITESIKNYITDCFAIIEEKYDLYVKPAFDNMKQVLTEVSAKVLEFYNQYIQPVLSRLAEKFSVVMEEHIKPAFDSFTTYIGTAILAISEIWKNYLSPFIQWIIDNILPYLVPIFENLGNTFIMWFGFIGDAVKLVWDGLTAFITFIKDVFAGDWEGAWNTIKDFAVEVWNTLKDDVEQLWNQIIENITAKLDAFKGVFTTVFTSIKDTVSDLFTQLWDKMKGIINSILGGIESMANGVVSGINTVISSLNNLKIDVPDWVTKLTGVSAFGFNIPSLGSITIPKLANGAFVKANTPQLAMIGDNMHQGEIVSPEDKLLDMAVKAANLAKGTDSGSIYLPIIIELLKKLIELISALDFDVELDGKSMLKELKETQKRLGFQF